MMSPSSSTGCEVQIVAPNGTQFVFGRVSASGRAPRTVPHDGHVIAVEVQKDLSQAVGAFTLTLDPLPDPDGRRWDERIPMRSLVFIDLRRSGASDLPDVDPTVMIGLTDTHSVQESFAEAGPRRVVQLRGRELSCVILDAVLVYHPLLASNPDFGTITTESESAGRGALQSALLANPLLGSPGDPRDILRLLLDLYLFQGGNLLPPAPQTSPSETPVPQHPLISLDVPGVKLSDLLAPNYSAWTTFEDVFVPILPQFPSQVGSLWNYLHIFIDRVFQEFFTRIEGGQCVIHFRGKPFLHKRIISGTRFKSTETEPTLQTLELDPADIIARQQERESSNVYNFFTVVPRGMLDARIGVSLEYQAFPQVVTDHAHPSFVGRYGLRVLRVESPYLSYLNPLSSGVGAPTAAVQPLKPVPGGAATYATMANRIAAEQGLPAALRPWFVALIENESSFNPNAVHRNADGSLDEGIAQFHKPYPPGIVLVNPYDPDEALRAAATYWMQMRAMPWIGNNPELLVAGYNAGPGAVQAAGGVPQNGITPKLVRAVAASVPRYQDFAGGAQATAAGDLRSVGVPPPSAQATGLPPEDQHAIVQTAQRWAAILAGWYDAGGELFGGTLTVRGHPAWNVGQRLLSRDARGPWEAYIEGVTHRYEARTGQYLTTLRITRGWYLSAAIAQQIWQEGQTTITKASGGPPVLDPETGEVLGPGRGEVTITEQIVDGIRMPLPPGE